MINIGIIGAGYWGQNLIRVFNQLSSSRVLWVADFDREKLDKIKSLYPHMHVATDYKDILRDSSVDAVLVATPVSTHFGITRDVLEANKHVWVEKPITEKTIEARELINFAKLKNKILLVDHTFLYSPAVRKIKEFYKNNELGNMQYVDSERVNLGLIQPDINVIYDLATHDISIFNYVLEEKPLTVFAAGSCKVTKGRAVQVEEMAHIILKYPNDILAHIHISWLSPTKLRKMLFCGDKKMLVYNDVEPSEKIRLYHHGIDVDFSKETTKDPIYRSGDVVIPRLEHSETLVNEAEHFVDCIINNKTPLTDGENGYEVVKVLEACNISLKEDRIVYVN